MLGISETTVYDLIRRDGIKTVTVAKVSRGMIYKWMDDGKFSAVKIGNISRVKRDEFEAWLEERKGN